MHQTVGFKSIVLPIKLLLKSKDLRQSKSHPGSKVERMLGKLGGEEADKDEVGRSAWVENTHIVPKNAVRWRAYAFILC